MLKWMAQQVIEKMEEEWKIVTLSREASAAIDTQLAEALVGIKNDFDRKHAASPRYVAEIESTTSEV